MKRTALVGWIVLIGLLTLSGCQAVGLQQRLKRGITEFQLGRLDKAKAQLEQALAISPSNPDALFYMARAHHADGAYEHAIYYYQCCVDADPGYPQVREYLAGAQRQAGITGPGLRFIPDLAED